LFKDARDLLEASDSMDLKERSTRRSVTLLNFGTEELAWWQATRKDGHICAMKIM